MSRAKGNGSDKGLRNEALAAAIYDYLKRMHRGESVDFDELVNDYPDHAAELSELLTTMEGLLASDSSSSDSSSSDSSSSGSRRANGSGASGGRKSPRTLGDFHILREIARGGMGVVYEAEQISLTRRVALKVLPFASMLDEKQLQRFLNEARAAAGLHHTNIVPVFAVGSERGVHFYAMQYIEGCTLEQFIRYGRPEILDSKHGTASEETPSDIKKNDADAGRPSAESRPALDPEATLAVDYWADLADPKARSSDRPGKGPSPETKARVLEFMRDAARSAHYFRAVAEKGVQLAEALEYAHSLGVIHRDIKPSNLMLDGDGTVWITDFGLAHMEANPDLTRTGEIVGTARYMSPEQALGLVATLDHRADVYSLGVTLYEMLTFQPAFEDSKAPRLLRQVVERHPPRLRRVNPAVPRDLETIVLKAMQKDREDRYRSAQELADDLRRFRNLEPIHARRPTVFERGVKLCQRHSLVVALVALTLSVLTAAATVAAFRIQHARDEALNHAKLAREALDREKLIRERAEASEVHAQRLLFLADMRLAAQAWHAGDVLQYDDLLKRHWLTAESPDIRGFASSYLWNRGHVETRILPSHSNPVRSVRVSPDRRWVATAGYDGILRLLDVESLGQVNAIQRPGERICGVDFSPDSRRIAAVGSDGCVRLYDLESGNEVWASDVHQSGGYHYQIVWSRDGGLLASCGSQPGIHLIDSATGDSVGLLEGHTDAVFALAASPTDPWLASASRDHTVRLWDLNSQESIHQHQRHNKRLTSLAFSPDGRFLASGSIDRKALVWDALEWKQVAELSHVDEVGALAFSDEGRWLATGDRNRSIHLWRLSDDGEFQKAAQAPPLWPAHDGRIYTLDFLPDGRMISGGEDGQVKLWAPFTERALTTHRLGEDENIYDIQYAPGERNLIVAAGTEGVYLWDAASQTLEAKLPSRLQGPNPDVAVSPGGELAAVAAIDPSQIEFWHLPSRTRVGTLALDSENVDVRDCVFSADGELLAAADKGRGLLLVIEVDSATVLAELPAEQCHAAVFSADGTQVAVDALDDIVIWDWASERRIHTLRAHDSSVRDLALSPDGRQLASVSNDRQVKIWDWNTGRERRSLAGHKDRILAVAYSPDGRFLFTGDRSGSLFAWDLAVGLQLCELERFEGRVIKSLAFAPDGNTLACMLDGTQMTLLSKGRDP